MPSRESQVPREFKRSIAREGRKLDRFARERYGISGQALLAKTLKGESGFRMGAVSSAGARGAAQFIPGTRNAIVQRFGIDPWRSPEEAVKAARLHMQGKLGHRKGLEGYNPGGGQGYVNYILGQKVGSLRDVREGVSRETRLKSKPTDSRFEQALILREFRRQGSNPSARRAALFALGELEAKQVVAKPVRGPKPPRKDIFKASSTDWAGSREVAEKLTRGLGTPTSTKRDPSHNARIGGSPTSDHLTTNTNAYAMDIPISRSAARTIAKRLGIRRYKWGQTYNVSRGGYRVQLIAGSAGHLDHIHVGVRRVGK